MLRLPRPGQERNYRREQGELIVAVASPESVVTILSDGDDARVRCAASIFTEVAPHRKVGCAKLQEGKQPRIARDAEHMTPTAIPKRGRFSIEG